MTFGSLNVMFGSYKRNFTKHLRKQRYNRTIMDVYGPHLEQHYFAMVLRELRLSPIPCCGVCKYPVIQGNCGVCIMRFLTPDDYNQ